MIDKIIQIIVKDNIIFGLSENGTLYKYVEHIETNRYTGESTKFMVWDKVEESPKND